MIAGCTSELRQCGALVSAVVFAPDEPDLQGVHRNAQGEFVYEEVVKRIMAPDGETRIPRIYGRVIDWYRELNDGGPCLLFAPGVPESRGFVAAFNAQGIPAAHIDADTDEADRQQILADHKAGKIKIVCNRFVLREGYNGPWITHLILACAFGAPSSYIQAVGRGLRSWPGKERVLIQDHGGHWHRDGFGDPNQDREWALSSTDCSIRNAAKKKRQQEEQDGQYREPLCCPVCQSTRHGELICPVCGHEHKRCVRWVIQTDGTLKRQVGRVHKPKAATVPFKTEATSAFYQAYLNGRMTVGQMEAVFWKRHKAPFPDGVVRLKGGRLLTLPDRNAPGWDAPVAEVFRDQLPLKRRKNDAQANDPAGSPRGGSLQARAATDPPGPRALHVPGRAEGRLLGQGSGG